MTKTTEIMEATKKLEGFEETQVYYSIIPGHVKNLKMVSMMRVIENTY